MMAELMAAMKVVLLLSLKGSSLAGLKGDLKAVVSDCWLVDEWVV